MTIFLSIYEVCIIADVLEYRKSHHMNEFLKMDIFFFITSVAVVLFMLLGAVVLWRLSRVLKNIEHISEQVALESDTIRGDLALVRSDIRRGRGWLKSLLGFFGKTAKRASKDT